ncbi:MAG: hypothetical protein NTX15_03135 [Candidatus Kapabacteria bacterium]|nr:hypothetical protein [Candidatus Kapabacteria bacterium]
MFALNIAVRALVILVGVSILSGVFAPSGLGSPLQEVFGSIVILFGAYRIVTYLYQRKRQFDDQ